MHQRVEIDASQLLNAVLPAPAALAAVAIADIEAETPPLPREHPAWMRDSAAVSSRARALLERLRPIVVRVLSFWDHAARSLRIGGRTLQVDASGSYRID